MKMILLLLCFSGAAMAQNAPPQAPSAQHPQGVEKMPQGIIEGGLGYVYAAWGLGLLGLLVYGGSLILRRPTSNPPPGAP